MTEEVEPKKTRAVKAQEIMWSFTKFALSVGTYLGLHGLLIRMMIAGVAGGIVGVNLAIIYSVAFTAILHFWMFLGTL